MFYWGFVQIVKLEKSHEESVLWFSTSQIPDLLITLCLYHVFQAKLGNSWVSPNVGHLILKYLCPALHEVLQDGLKPYVLDLIIGQRRCQPWSLVEASTQLGESTVDVQLNTIFSLYIFIFYVLRMMVCLFQVLPRVLSTASSLK